MKKRTSANPRQISNIPRQSSRNTRGSHPACRKRLRFGDSDTADCLSGGKDDMILTKRILSNKSGEAKTSEFAYFKKLRGDASQGYRSRSENCLGKPSQKSERCNFVSGSEKFNNGAIIRDSCKDLNSSSIDSFSSTSNCETENSEVELTKACKMSRSEFSSILENTKTHDGGFKFMGSYEHKGVFFNKRQNLNQWITDVSIPGMDEFHSKGQLIADDGYNHLKEPFPKRLEAETELKSFSPPELDIRLSKPYLRLLELNDVKISNNRISHYKHTGTSEPMSSGIESMTYHSVKPNIQYSPTDSVCEFGGSCPLSFSKISTFDFSGKGHEKASCRIQELDDCDLNACQLERQPISLLPVWDHEDMADGQSLSIPSSDSALKSSSVSCFEDGLQNNFGATEFCMSSFFLSSPSNSAYPMQSCLANRDHSDAGRHGDHKSMALVSSHLSILQEPNSPSLPANFDFNNEFKSSHILPSPENCKWSMGKVLSESRAIQSSGIGTELEWKYLSLAGSSKVYRPPSSSTIPSLPSSLFLAQDEQTGYMDSSVCEGSENQFVLKSVDAPNFMSHPTIFSCL